MKIHDDYFGVLLTFFAVCVLLLSCVAGAAEISAFQAAKAASNWIKQSPHPLGTQIGQTVRTTKTYKDPSGTPLFHVVNFEEGGFVITSADDRILPIIAFSDGGDLIADERNPLWVLLNRDLPQRLAKAKAWAIQPQTLATPNATGLTNKSEWQSFLADNTYVPLGFSGISDVRVSPLVQSKWSQTTVGGYNTYNYYTPNNYYCGCVATAGAQIMRMHQYPTASVTAGTYTCFVDNIATYLTMLGGTYSWSDMPLVPSDSITLAQRQAIGKLTYDVGVASYMKYRWDGSGAFDSNLAAAFTGRFGYASARLIMDPQSGVDEHLQQAALANLDAGFPVAFGIHGQSGHEVVGDGYGYSGSTLYVHLNMGWEGIYDAWYNLPTIDSYPSYSVLKSIIYNIFPTHAGEVISGRVLDCVGNPVSGASVVTLNETIGATLPTVTSNGKGIYAVLVPSPPPSSTHNYRLTATSRTLTVTQNTTLTPSVSTSTWYYESTGTSTYSPGTGSVGNRWGVNLTFLQPVAPANVNASDGDSTDSVTISWTASPGATSYNIYRNTLNNSSSVSLLNTTSSTTYTDNTASTGVLYYYWVKASNSAGTSGFSLPDTGYCYFTLVAPTDVSASDGDSTDNVTISWTASSGATSYNIYRHTLNDSSSASLLNTTSSTTYTDNTASPGVLYYYWVKAVKFMTTSEFSSPDTGYCALSAPIYLSASDYDSDAVTLTWNAVTGASHYRVYRSTSYGGTKTAIGSWQTDLSYADTSGIARMTYYYWVKAAVDSSGNRPSDYSSYVTGLKPRSSAWFVLDSVTATPRWPWNGKVDIVYEIVSDDPDVDVMVSFSGRDTDRNLYIPVRAVTGDIGTVKPGLRRAVWDAAADVPGINAAAFALSVTVAAYEDRYLLIDLSGGSSVEIWPTSFIDDVPPGGWTDEHKTNLLVLRKIPKGSFMMGSPTDELGRLNTETQHQVTLSKDFFIGVFEVTQRQWELVMGNRPSYYSNTTYYQTRPVEQVSYNEIRENPENSPISPNWPQSGQVHVNSFMGKLRDKTEPMPWEYSPPDNPDAQWEFDLPTEAQWEYACRAGTTTALNSGKDLTNSNSCPNVAEMGRYSYNRGSGYSSNSDPSKGTALVGSYLPNGWGIYDMHGNVWEWCLDKYDIYRYKNGIVSDPVGATSGGINRVTRGGGWSSIASGCRSACRTYSPQSSRPNFIGFRVACTLPSMENSPETVTAPLFRLETRECFGGRLAYGTTTLSATADGVSTGAISGAGALGNFPIWNSGADSPIWNTTQHADGWYDLTLTAASTATASLALLNTNALVHEGTLTANATWSSNKVQVVKHWVVVPSNRRLILGPGTIVKFTENTGIQVNDRGILTLKGVALTHIADDAVGGDTNMDGTQTQPPAGVGDAWLAWAFLPSMERVVFDAQGGSNEPDRFYTTGQTYGWLPKPTRAGYVFDGWRTAPHGGGTQVFENSAPSSGVHTLYATWSGITTTTPIPVPHVWLEDYGLVTDGDYEAAAFADTDGDGYPAWQEYIAGTDPTNRNSIFATIITISNDTPFLTWMPDMRPERLYTVEGKARLTDSLWISPTNAASRFFRVKVEMPK